MEYSPKLVKQRSCSCSCSCPSLFDIQNWCSGRRQSGHHRFDEEDYYYDDDEENYTSTARANNGLMRWRGVWRRIVKGKRSFFYSGAPMHGPYNEYTYAQNFDEGSAWVEPENLARSFSARFAMPRSSKLVRRLD